MNKIIRFNIFCWTNQEKCGIILFEGDFMTIVFEQMILLFAFIMFGWIFGKAGIVKAEHSKILSVLCVYLFLPCTSIKAFSSNFSIENLKKYYPLLGVSLIILTFLFVVALFCSKLLSKNAYMRNVMLYTLVIPNYGYMGYALAEGIYGTGTLLDMIIYAIPFSIFTYTVGYFLLTGGKISFKRLLNPPLISVVVGIIIGLFGITFPDVVNTFIDKAASCMAPTSMLLAGITISEFKTKELVTDKKIYIVSFLRLLVIPLGLLLLFGKLLDADVIRVVVLLCAMPCGLNTIVFPKLVGEDCTVGAKLAFVSNILALGTIPFVLHFI